MRLDLTTLLVTDYDEAIGFFTTALGFVLAEDTPRPTEEVPDKRWVVVRPPGAAEGAAEQGAGGLLLARAEGEEQRGAVGRQAGGRVGHFLHVDDFDAQLSRMTAAGVELLEEPRHEVYGTVVVFRDVAGNPWDLLGPPGAAGTTEP